MTKTVELQDPFDNGSERIESFDLRDLTGKDLESFPIGTPTVGNLLDVAASLAEVPPPVMRKLSGRDAMAVAIAVGELMEGGHPTGET